MAELMKQKAGFVTGAGAGIGRASAIEFAREGAQVVVADINEENARETVAIIEQHGGVASASRCDVTNEDDVKRLVAETVSRYGKLDFAHANAGIIPQTGLLADTDSDNWKKVIDVNLIGTYYCLKHAITAMLENGQGTIVCTSSVAGLMGGRFQSSYATSKWALNGLVKCAALEYARHNIRVNAINPGATMTAMAQQALAENPDQHAALQESIPSGVIATPENHAKAAVWLCANFNDQITGTTLVIDGGYSAGRYNL